ncbi:hypothetical protein lerEdw1_017110 [Lerista edwardsae]|nr:hypothetical protein lerEdw1_017110 [Lerista edwardsae]
MENHMSVMMDTCKTEENHVTMWIYFIFQVIIFVHKDTDVVKTQNAETGTQELLVNAKVVMSLSKGILPTVKVNNVFCKVA